MRAESGYARRCAKLRRTFGTADIDTVTGLLRERRAAVLAALLRRAFDVLVAGRRRMKLARPVQRAASD